MVQNQRRRGRSRAPRPLVKGRERWCGASDRVVDVNSVQIGCRHVVLVKAERRTGAGFAFRQGDGR